MQHCSAELYELLVPETRSQGKYAQCEYADAGYTLCVAFPRAENRYTALRNACWLPVDLYMSCSFTPMRFSNETLYACKTDIAAFS